MRPATRQHRKNYNDPGHAHELTFSCYQGYPFKYLRKHAPHWLPRLTRKRGKRTERLFWQSGGGFDRNIKKAKTLLAMIEYIHLNPVRRGFVANAVDWKWSSARWFELGEPTPIDLDPIPPEWLDMDDVA